MSFTSTLPPGNARTADTAPSSSLDLAKTAPKGLIGGSWLAGVFSGTGSCAFTDCTAHTHKASAAIEICLRVIRITKEELPTHPVKNLRPDD